MADTQSRYRVREGAFDADACTVLQLWEEGFDVSREDLIALKLNWMYRDNPAGPGRLFLLEDSAGRAVGVQCLGARAFAHEGRELRGGIMADFVVEQEHRSLGPALRLLGSAVTGGKGTLDFLYGFPNVNAVSVFKRAGYRTLGWIRRYAKPLRSHDFLEQRRGSVWATLLAPVVDLFLLLRDAGAYLTHARRYRWSDAAGFDHRFDDLWEKRARGPLLTSERSKRMLEWRFCQSYVPEGWRVMTIGDRASDALAGYLVWRPFEGGMAQVGDFFSLDAEATTRPLMAFLSWQARRAGCNSVSAEFSGSPAVEASLIGAGLRRREESPVYYVDYSEAGTAIAPARMDWYITRYDRDG